jgi:hypothetical protein
MEERYSGPNVYRPMMAGLFVGIIATVFNIFYDVIYRESTGFELSTIINVSTLIFGTLLLTLAAGSIYGLLAQFIKKPALVCLPFFVYDLPFMFIARMIPCKTMNFINSLLPL